MNQSQQKTVAGFDSIDSILDALQRRVDLEHVGEDPGTFRAKVVVANTASKCSLVSDEKMAVGVRGC